MASHRLTTYIAKNPPDAVTYITSLVTHHSPPSALSFQENKSETAPETKAKGKSKGKKKDRSAGGNRDSDEGSPNEHNGKTVRYPHIRSSSSPFIVVIIQNGTSKNGSGGSGGGDDDDEDEDWGDDLTPAVAELNTQIKGMIQTDDLDKPLAERCDQFNQLVEVCHFHSLSSLSLCMSVVVCRTRRRKRN